MKLDVALITIKSCSFLSIVDALPTSGEESPGFAFGNAAAWF